MKRIQIIQAAVRNAGFIWVGALAFTAALQAAAPEPMKTNWRVYVDAGGNYKLNYPSSWHVLTKGNAVVITSPGDADVRGVFGITPRPSGAPMEEAVTKEFEDPDRPADLMKSPARIATLPAIKVWGSKKGDPNTRVVEYYVQKGSDEYYILFQAPHATMARYSSIFNSMIASMKFLK